MRQLTRIVRSLIAAERPAVLRGLALAVTVLAMGAALLGLSGWFITAAAAAGMAGAGLTFNVFGPSATVRFLALGRTAARYGERLTSHDAVLRAISDLRVAVLRSSLGAPHRALERLRATVALNRVTGDVDALDGALLRLVLPGLAGGVTLVLASAALWWLVHPVVALEVGLGYLIGPNLVFLMGSRRARRPSRTAEAALQATRGRIVDLVSARDDLTVFGQLGAALARAEEAVRRHHQARRKLDRIEQGAGLQLDLIGAAITAAVLGTGAALAQAGQISAAQAAIGVFTALALDETVAPVRRALAEIGRMIQAARRVAPSLAPQPRAAGAALPPRGRLDLRGVGHRPGPGAPFLFPPLSLSVAPGQTVALTGSSGSGKSTLLLIAAGALEPDMGQVLFGGVSLAGVDPAALRDRIVLVPQRHGLIAGSIAENLRLAAPGASEGTLWAAVEACGLTDTISARAGLETRLGYRGSGLSGGEGRRLVLARAVLRRPAVLLLDEPTEGLDGPLAARVLQGLRGALPDAAILMAAHRDEETGFADRVVPIGGLRQND